MAPLSAFANEVDEVMEKRKSESESESDPEKIKKTIERVVEKASSASEDEMERRAGPPMTGLLFHPRPQQEEMKEEQP